MATINFLQNLPKPTIPEPTSGEGKDNLATAFKEVLKEGTQSVKLPEVAANTRMSELESAWAKVRQDETKTGTTTNHATLASDAKTIADGPLGRKSSDKTTLESEIKSLVKMMGPEGHHKHKKGGGAEGASGTSTDPTALDLDTTT